MYKIIHVDKSWIVCEGQAGLIVFDRKSLAVQAVHDAKELLRASEKKVQVNSSTNGKAA